MSFAGAPGRPTLAQAARAIRAGTLSPVALMTACLARWREQDDTLHAVVALDADAAMREAERLQAEQTAGRWRGPLHGVPIGIKDVVDVAGFATRAQSRQRSAAPAVRDAVAVARLRAAGAIIVGKLTTHEYAFGSPDLATESAHPAITDAAAPAARNPWDPRRFAGGSSSGSAVGVATGMVLGALGTDTAGSVRSPAALCGVTGFKPTRTHIAQEGVVSLAPSLDSVGMIADTVEDCAWLYAVLTGQAVDDTGMNGPWGWSVQRGDRALAGRRIGVVRHFMRDGVPVSVACAAAIDQVAAECVAAGAIVTDVVLPPLETWQAAGMTLLLSEAFSAHAATLRAAPERYGDSFAEAVSLGAFLTADDVRRAASLRETLTACANAAMSDVEVLLAPIQPGTAPLLDDLRQWGFLERPSYGLPFNVADLPAVSLCCGFGEDGLPLSLQWVGRRHADAELLSVADAYQQRTAWHRRRP